MVGNHRFAALICFLFWREPHRMAPSPRNGRALLQCIRLVPEPD